MRVTAGQGLLLTLLVMPACTRYGFPHTQDDGKAQRDLERDGDANRSELSLDRPRNDRLAELDGSIDRNTAGDFPRKDGPAKIDRAPGDKPRFPDHPPPSSDKPPTAADKPWPDKPKGDSLSVPSVSFSLLTPSAAPAARRSSGAALQQGASSERIWIFGGFAGTARNDLHSYDVVTNSWTAATQSGTPSPRERHALAWHPPGGRLVLFGGQVQQLILFNPTDELWTYDPVAKAWTQSPKVSPWPAARKDHALVWIPHLGKFLLYGGNSGTGATSRFNDLWLLSLSGTTASWSQLQSPPGPAQSAACVVYDPSARRLILFGGEVKDGDSVGGTYQYFVDSNHWKTDSTVAAPSDRSFAQCAWDPVHSLLLLYGGQDDAGNPLAGAFTYQPDVMKWNALLASPTVGVRSDAGAVYSAMLGGMFWFGGRVGLTSYTDQSWVFKIF